MVGYVYCFMVGVEVFLSVSFIVICIDFEGLEIIWSFMW